MINIKFNINALLGVIYMILDNNTICFTYKS